MRKIACLPDDDRRELFRNTADKIGLNDAIVEKDFWVCHNDIPDITMISIEWLFFFFSN